MSRQSGRLLSMGYYDDDEEHRISYKESPYKVFRRRRGHRHSGASTISNMSSMSFADDIGHLPASNCRDRNNFWARFGQKTVVSLLFIILMCFGGCLYALSRTCASQGSGRPDHLDWVRSEMSMMQAQLAKLQEDVAEADLRTMQMQLKELQEELLHLRNKLLPLAETMPNFALHSQGAAVLRHLSSETYHTEPPLVTIWGIPLWYPPTNPQTVIQAHSSPLTLGRCWAFAGERGHAFIALSHSVTITHVTMVHISSRQIPIGFAYSAPREFSVYGVKKVDGEATCLGTFEYDANGESLQTFKLPGHTKGVFKFVKLQIESNWGHPEYTCLYNFRVHGRCYKCL